MKPFSLFAFPVKNSISKNICPTENLIVHKHMNTYNLRERERACVCTWQHPQGQQIARIGQGHSCFCSFTNSSLKQCRGFRDFFSLSKTTTFTDMPCNVFFFLCPSLDIDLQFNRQHKTKMQS